MSSQKEEVYQQALQKSSETEAPGVGLATTSTNITIPLGFKTLIQQNNTIIELCVQLSKQVKILEGRIISLEKQKATVPVVSESLITKLENLSLGPKEKPKEPKGLLRVHRNPNHLLKEELDKLKQKQV